jgi:N-acetylmuramoyl-L-alanine amidase
MKYIFACLFLVFAAPAFAQDFSGLARVDMAKSQVSDDGSDLLVDLHLSQTVPYRVFTLDEPRRLVIDFREVDWTGVSAAALRNADLAPALRFGVFRPGWSRLVVDLAEPLNIHAAGLTVDQDSGAAHLQVRLVPAKEDVFADRAGAPQTPGWETDAGISDIPVPATEDGPTVIVIDPGHGGIDPGAERGGVQEADLMLALGIEVADAINRLEGFRAVLTRTSDIFVPLEARMSIARSAGADLFISLHADALEEDAARGASIYTLNQEGSDSASQRMAERHERGDLLAGLDLAGQDDRVVTVLMDLARAESGPAGQRFASTLVSSFRDTDVRLNSRPRREGRLAVLMAADFPSVLIEVGFLSSAADRAALSEPAGRVPLVEGLSDAVRYWAMDEAVREPLIRQ